MSTRIKNICKLSYRLAGSDMSYVNLPFSPGSAVLVQSFVEHNAGARYPVEIELKAHNDHYSLYHAIVHVPIEVLVELSSGDPFVLGSDQIPVTLTKLEIKTASTCNVKFQNQALSPIA